MLSLNLQSRPFLQSNVRGAPAEEVTLPIIASGGVYLLRKDRVTNELHYLYHINKITSVEESLYTLAK